jgi:hypothetical protein
MSISISLFLFSFLDGTVCLFYSSEVCFNLLFYFFGGMFNFITPVTFIFYYFYIKLQEEENSFDGNGHSYVTKQM